MNHVTRGLGKRSGMLVTAGLGRRVIFVLEVMAQYAAAGSRVWVAFANDRAWQRGAFSRTWEVAEAARSWMRLQLTRTSRAYSTSRSWLLGKLRAWGDSSDRSHDA